MRHDLYDVMLSCADRSVGAAGRDRICPPGEHLDTPASSRYLFTFSASPGTAFCGALFLSLFAFVSWARLGVDPVFRAGAGGVRGPVLYPSPLSGGTVGSFA